MKDASPNRILQPFGRESNTADESAKPWHLNEVQVKNVKSPLQMTPGF
jgi:hypothetical protein